MALLAHYSCGCPAGHPSRVTTNEREGNRVCEDCGHVLEENDIVAEVTFIEGGNGGHTAIGGIVNAENVGRHIGPGFGRSSGGSSATSDARYKINQIAQSLGLSNAAVTDAAHRLYTLAYTHTLTRGKRKSLVCAACLYIALRREKQAVMLIELAELVGASVFKLGAVFMRLRREFPSVANVDDIDPSVYISRFAQALEFGDKTRDVANDALLLVKRMQLDWIADGRRPAGICGASLLIAARMHHFHRTVKEIIQVVKMADSTVLQRLREFEQTPAAALPVHEFRNIATSATAVQPSLPPSFVRNRKRDIVDWATAAGSLDSNLVMECDRDSDKNTQLLTPPSSSVQVGFDRKSLPSVFPLQSKKRKRKAPASTNSKSCADKDVSLDLEEDHDRESAELFELKSEIMFLAKKLISTEFVNKSPNLPIPSNASVNPSTLQLFDKRVNKKRRTSSTAMSTPVCDAYLIQALNSAIPKNAATLGEYSAMDPSVPGASIAVPNATAQVRDILPMSRLIKEHRAKIMNPGTEIMELEDEDDQCAYSPPPRPPTYIRCPDAGQCNLTEADCQLSDLDNDPEIVSAIECDPSVLQLRQQVWLYQNREWMEKQAESQQLKAERAKQSGDGQKRTNRRRKNGDSSTRPRNAVDAIHGMVVQKLSSKINRTSVEQLFDPELVLSAPAVRPRVQDLGEEEWDGVAEEGVDDGSQDPYNNPFASGVPDFSAMYGGDDDGYEGEV